MKIRYIYYGSQAKSGYRSYNSVQEQVTGKSLHVYRIVQTRHVLTLSQVLNTNTQFQYYLQK